MILFDRPTRPIGSRGSRRFPEVRVVSVRPIVPAVPDPGRVDATIDRADVKMGFSAPVLDALRAFLRRRHDRTPVPSPPAPPPESAPAPDEATESLERGLRDIRRLDPGFDPGRFIGYVGMVFRDAQAAWMARDFGNLRDRVTPEMYAALEAQCARLRNTGRANRVEEVDIAATVTEAWQEGGRDYATALIGGSMIDYTVDEASRLLVDGSRTVPGIVEEFWTFTRPTGLNFWMLCGIQTA